MPERPAGKVEHYYPKVNAAAVRLTRKVKLGDKVHIVGHGDDFQEKVTSMQLDHKPIEEGQPGQSIGLWVKERVHEGDDVLLVEDEAWPKAKPKKAMPKKASKPRKAASRPRKAAKPSKKKSAPRRKSAKSRKAKAGKRPARKMAKKAGRKKR